MNNVPNIRATSKLTPILKENKRNAANKFISCVPIIRTLPIPNLPQIRQRCVPFALQHAAPQQNAQLIRGTGRLQLAGFTVVSAQRILRAQVLQLKNLGGIGEPVHALAVAHALDHCLDLVRTIFTAGQLNNCVSVLFV